MLQRFFKAGATASQGFVPIRIFVAVAMRSRMVRVATTAVDSGDEGGLV